MTDVSVEDVWRASAPHVLAALVRRYGDVDAAEDALQEALLAASHQWPRDGRPDDPQAWLIRVASRRVLDYRRADWARAQREQAVARFSTADERQAPAADAADAAGRDELDDSVILLLLCCHPALPPAAQVALTLRAIAGLRTAQIARAFMVPEATMAQRISRAKARLREVGARFTAPPPAQLRDRLTAVAHVLYLVFTEGHTSTTGGELYDVSLTAEAIRLTRHLHDHVPGAGEITGLLALMLLVDARREARIDAQGRLVPLAEQDRRRWDRRRIEEGIALVESALPSGPVGPYQLQAAIAAVHAEAARAEDTDWAQIEALYRMLVAIAPGPVVTLNHAVAVAMVDGAAAGQRMLDPLSTSPPMRRSHRFHAVRAHLLEMSGDTGAAAEAYAAAARLATSIPEQRYLRARAAANGPEASLSPGS
ncbi:MAG: RNA polymerase sigma factor [Kineosporiaceae bacterium]